MLLNAFNELCQRIHIYVLLVNQIYIHELVLTKYLNVSYNVYGYNNNNIIINNNNNNNNNKKTKTKNNKDFISRGYSFNISVFHEGLKLMCER